MARPRSTDYPEFFARYISLVPEEDITMALANQLPVIIMLLDSISEKDSMYAYSPGKWTMKEMLQHIIDAESMSHLAGHGPDDRLERVAGQSADPDAR